MTSDEIVVVTAVVVTEEPEARPPSRNRAMVADHWCMHVGCKDWGYFGYQTRHGAEWYCLDHRADGEAKRR